MDVIATREFEYWLPGATQPATARLVLGRPEHDGEAWIAPYEIHGITPEPIREGSWGDDAVQALLLSFQIIYVLLERPGGRLTLAGHEGAPWDHGLPPHVEPDPRLVTEFKAQLASYLATEPAEERPPSDRGRRGDDRGVDDIAIRELDYVAPGTTKHTPTRLVLRKPRPEGETWVAPYDIHGITPEPIRGAVHGEDAVQALLLALQMVSARLDLCGANLTLADSEGAPWDHGLPVRVGLTASKG